MTVVLSLLALQGLIGAFDTLYFHEWRAKLPALGRAGHAELRLHGVRSVLYAVIFGTLPWLAWHGIWAWLLAVIMAAEIVITLADFVVEDEVRRVIGGVFPGERVTHAVMGIIYGAMLGYLVPELLAWSEAPTAMVFQPADAPGWLRWLLVPMAAGVLLSGLRDLAVVFELPHAGYPWASKE